MSDSLASEFKKYLNKTELPMFSYVLSDNGTPELIEQHLVEFGHHAKVKSFPFEDADGVDQDSVEFAFEDGSLCAVYAAGIDVSF